MEEWRDIEGYEGLYQVSNYGRVKSLERTICEKGGKVRKVSEKILKQILGKNGYFGVGLSKNGISKRTNIHRLVAEAFITNPNKYNFVNHKDECKTNNFVDNLEWCTNEYNIKYGSAKERMRKKHEKPIYQYTLEWELVDIYESVKKAAEANGFAASCISNCALGKQGRKQHNGYRWSFEPL